MTTTQNTVFSKPSLLNRLIEPRQQIPEERKRFSNAALKELIFPIIIEQFLALLVGIADTLMVSHVGEAAVSGVSLVNQLNNVLLWSLLLWLLAARWWSVNTSGIKTGIKGPRLPASW